MEKRTITDSRGQSLTVTEGQVVNLDYVNIWSIGIPGGISGDTSINYGTVMFFKERSYVKYGRGYVRCVASLESVAFSSNQHNIERWQVGAKYKLPNSLGSIETALPEELISIVEGRSNPVVQSRDGWNTFLTFKKLDVDGEVIGVHTSRAWEKQRLVMVESPSSVYRPDQQPWTEEDI